MPGTSTRISATQQSTELAASSGIYKNGSIFTGHYDNWMQLSKAERNKVMNAWKNKGSSYEGKGKGKNGANKAHSCAIKALKQEIETQKCTIAALARKRAHEDSEKDNNDGIGQPSAGAGNAFGGRAEKASNKKKTQQN